MKIRCVHRNLKQRGHSSSRASSTHVNALKSLCFPVNAGYGLPMVSREQRSGTHVTRQRKQSEEVRWHFWSDMQYVNHLGVAVKMLQQHSNVWMQWQTVRVQQRLGLGSTHVQGLSSAISSGSQIHVLSSNDLGRGSKSLLFTQNCTNPGSFWLLTHHTARHIGFVHHIH